MNWHASSRAAVSPPSSSNRGMLVREVSPLIAIFYLTAIFERALGYRRGVSLDNSA